MKHQIYCLNLKLGMGEMVWKIENGQYFVKRPKDNRILMKFQIKWDIIRHAYANTHILLSAKCDLLKPPTMPEVFNRMHPLGILEGWKSILYMKIPRYRLEEQRSAWPVKKYRWEEEESGKQIGKIFVLRGRIFIPSGKRAEGLNRNGWGWEKGKKTGQGV